MKRFFRVLVLLTASAALLASAACEDDPHDLDYLHDDDEAPVRDAGDPGGDPGDDEDAG